MKYFSQKWGLQCLIGVVVPFYSHSCLWTQIPCWTISSLKYHHSKMHSFPSPRAGSEKNYGRCSPIMGISREENGSVPQLPFIAEIFWFWGFGEKSKISMGGILWGQGGNTSNYHTWQLCRKSEKFQAWLNNWTIFFNITSMPVYSCACPKEKALDLTRAS